MGEKSKKALEKIAQNAVLFTVLGSLVLHIFFALITQYFKPEKIKKTPLEAQVIFRDKNTLNLVSKDDDKKPVVNLNPENQEKPNKANYLAEHNQKTNDEKTAKLRRISETKNKSPQAKPEPKKTLLAGPGDSLPGPNRFLKDAQDNRPDPLGLRAMPLQDYLPTVQEGDNTELNAWQYRHANFFNRIKNSIARIWSPNSKIERFDPQGKLLGHLDRVTVMEVTIDRVGGLKSLSIANSSGVSYLDEEAERAFRIAAPFPYPPRELFKSNEEFTFKFAFHLQINRNVKLNFDWSSGG